VSGKFEIYKDNAGEFRFRLKAGNGENILASEGYKAKAGAENGVQSVKQNASDLSRFEKKTSSNGKAYFVLKAANHEVIGTSELYESEAARDKGIAAVSASAPSADVKDVT